MPPSTSDRTTRAARLTRGADSPAGNAGQFRSCAFPDDQQPYRTFAHRTLVCGVLVCGVLLTAIGCGGKPTNPYQLAPVTGKVTYEDGTPISTQPITIIFWPQTPPVNAKEAPPKGIGTVDPKDGSFTLTARNPNDGATVGLNRVTLAPEGAPLPEIPDECLSVVTTTIEVEVKPGSNTFGDLKVKKPTRPPAKSAPKR